MNYSFPTENAENRLILLYLLDKINMDLTDLHITKLIRENEIMNYFHMQEALHELLQASFVSKELTDNGLFLYSITTEGKKILDTLLPMIPIGIRLMIDSIITPSKNEIRADSLVMADFTPDQNQSFLVTCSASEDTFSLIKVDISVGSRSDAQDICENWKKHSHEIYPEIIEALFKKR